MNYITEDCFKIYFVYDEQVKNYCIKPVVFYYCYFTSFIIFALYKNLKPLSDNNSVKKIKEAFLHQRAVIVWMCGLSGSGKSTIANGLETELLNRKYFCQVLDGDKIRAGLNKDLGFSADDRKENLRRLAEVSKLFLDTGIIAINAFISPTIESRELAKAVAGSKNFIEVYINASLEVCEKRDTKGLYAKARKGLISDFTGISAVFEPPLSPDIEIRTDQLSVDESVTKLLNYILPKIEYKE